MSVYQIQVICKLLIPKKIRKYAELSTKVKQQWQVEAVYTLPVTISTTGVIPHTLHNVLQ
jgi:hypothetical protein